MASTPPTAPPGGRKSASQGPPISEDYGDYNDFESDATNVNQIPQATGPGGVPPNLSSSGPRPSQPPPMFPQSSPQVSHMVQPVPNLGTGMMPMPAGMAPQTGINQMPGAPSARALLLR